MNPADRDARDASPAFLRELDPINGQPACAIRVKAIPNAKRAGLAGALGDRLKVKVNAPAEGGKANHAIRQTIADALGVKLRDVEVIAGTTEPEKVLRVTGLTSREAAARLH